MNIIGGEDFSLVDMSEVSEIVRDMVSEDANIIVGTAMDESLQDEIKVTLIATGLDATAKRSRGGDRMSADVSKRVPPKYQEQTYSQPQQPAPSSDSGDDSIFSRRLKRSMDTLDVPSFFKTRE